MSILSTAERDEIRGIIVKIDEIDGLDTLAVFEQKLYMAKEDLTNGVFTWTIRAVEIRREILGARSGNMVVDGEVKSEEF